MGLQALLLCAGIVVGIGASFTGWLAFQIPDNTTVEALILQVETRVDANNRPVAEEVVVPLAPPQR